MSKNNEKFQKSRENRQKYQKTEKNFMKRSENCEKY